jgi:hypothetical protein
MLERRKRFLVRNRSAANGFFRNPMAIPGIIEIAPEPVTGHGATP